MLTKMNSKDIETVFIIYKKDVILCILLDVLGDHPMKQAHLLFKLLRGVHIINVDFVIYIKMNVLE